MEIALKNLVRTYPAASASGQDVHAVRDVSLTIPSNSIYGIIGKSGAGKSTLVRLISLLEKPDSGSVLYDNQQVDNLKGDALIQRRRRIGMIFQSFNLFSSRTAAKNIAYPLEICGTPANEIRTRVAELLELVGLADRANSPISQLSGGQKQRIAIARALANRPDILFCDEATSALDPQTTRSILTLIREIQRRMQLTVVMITHQMEVVRDACDYVAVLEGGKVVEEGSVSQIFSYPQSPVTKDFLANLSVMPSDADESASSADSRKGQEMDGQAAGTPSQGLVRWSDEGGKYTLRFINHLTGEPVLSRMAHQFEVEFNIRAGGIQHIATESEARDIGTLLVDIHGEQEELDRALDFLREQGVIVEEA
ncbi:MAG: methionine ABC transporter ATP-binding protein [Spirochaetaceae bacterium]|nr:methionine ABC transporter ATP-binding protein [Spirochaetaceae bacterium]